jgi:hypothetical protein
MNRNAVAIAIVFAVLPAAPANAFDLYRDATNELRFDNTLAYSAGFRLVPRDPVLLADPNSDDGNRNFAPGLVSDRLDLLSQLDFSSGDFGARLSATGWYDSVYFCRNDNNSPATFNPFSVPHDHFTSAVQALHGLHAELLDGFVHGTFALGDMPLSFRVGRYTLLWGESLFFSDNGIAAGQAPIDEIRVDGQPGTYTRDAFLPVAQASMSLQVTPTITAAAYYQFEWRRTRLPGSGSYFSQYDYVDKGGERFILAPGRYLFRSRDLVPRGTDQFGVSLEVSEPDLSYGFYALRFDAKDREVYLRPNGSPGPDAGTYQLVYPEGIQLYGASFSTYLGDATVGGEISYRQHMPLVTNPILVPVGAPADTGRNALYPIGDTLHWQVSSTETFDSNQLWDRADINVELAANEVLALVRNKAALDPTRNRFAAAVRATFEPQYFQVLPGLDLSPLIGFGYDFVGGSSTDESDTAHAGDVELGFSGTFRTNWRAHLSYTHFLGSALHQPYGDRGFLSLGVERTF